jgi:hypothetical protein
MLTARLIWAEWAINQLNLPSRATDKNQVPFPTGDGTFFLLSPLPERLKVGNILTFNALFPTGFPVLSSKRFI